MMGDVDGGALLARIDDAADWIDSVSRYKYITLSQFPRPSGSLSARPPQQPATELLVTATQFCREAQVSMLLEAVKGSGSAARGGEGEAASEDASKYATVDLLDVTLRLLVLEEGRQQGGNEEEDGEEGELLARRIRLLDEPILWTVLMHLLRTGPVSRVKLYPSSSSSQQQQQLCSAADCFHKARSLWLRYPSDEPICAFIQTVLWSPSGLGGYSSWTSEEHDEVWKMCVECMAGIYALAISTAACSLDV